MRNEVEFWLSLCPVPDLQRGQTLLQSRQASLNAMRGLRPSHANGIKCIDRDITASLALLRYERCSLVEGNAVARHGPQGIINSFPLLSLSLLNHV